MEKVTTQPYFSVALATTCSIFKFEDERLKILLVRRDRPGEEQKYALPGVLVLPEQDVEETAFNLIEQTAGAFPLEMHQIKAFANPDRHPDGRVVNVAYYALVRTDDDLSLSDDRFKAKNWFDCERIPEMVMDHEEVIQSALKRVKKRMRRHPVAFRLLPHFFTLNDLQALYELVFETELDKRNFRKKVQASGLVVDSGKKKERESGQGRSANLYYFDWEIYKSDRESMFHFDL